MKQRSSRNRTISVEKSEAGQLRNELVSLESNADLNEIENRIIHADVFEVLDFLPPGCVDLMILDPPYNLSKSFNGRHFRGVSTDEYARWFESWFARLLPALKETSSVYICSDWRTSTAVHLVIDRYLKVRNRITWEREKGRGALSNWKNCSEDIWFCTVSDNYTFNLNEVRLKRRVVAPYRHDGEPKDWEQTSSGKYRLTYPSNLWTDLTVPFWSMPENTDHPTQKPEKLVAKLVLASSSPGHLILDPFLGSGTSAVVAKKLGRRFIGIERDEEYCCVAQKRLHAAEKRRLIQGYEGGVFWDRNLKPDPTIALNASDSNSTDA